MKVPDKIEPDLYVEYVGRLARLYGQEDMLKVCMWQVEGDKYLGTMKGLERWHCVFSLEHLFLEYLMPGGQWSESHRLMCRELSYTNPYVSYLGLKARGTWGKVAEEYRIPLEEKFSKMDLLTMILMYRGYFKTTLFGVGHTIQELIINPDLRLLVMSGSLDQSQSIVGIIKSHFTLNDKFRWLFDDYCPKENTVGKIEFGTMDEFTLPNRKRFDYREPTVKAAGVGTKLAGYHFDKHLKDDLIDDKNVTTSEMLEKAKEADRLSKNLFDNITRPFSTYLGTHYHSLDLYMDFKKQYADDSGKCEYMTYNPVSKSLEKRVERVA